MAFQVMKNLVKRVKKSRAGVVSGFARLPVPSDHLVDGVLRSDDRRKLIRQVMLAQRTGVFALSIAWNRWREVGMAVDAWRAL